MFLLGGGMVGVLFPGGWEEESMGEGGVSLHVIVYNKHYDQVFNRVATGRVASAKRCCILLLYSRGLTRSRNCMLSLCSQ